jgi:dTDP-4-dehydrorhamnose 3,5-epimerase
MPFTETHIKGLVIFDPQVWGDDRGYFYESYNANTFKAAGLDADFVQDNQAYSSYGVLRGLHYQVGEFAQAKLVRCIQGEVLDVVVDIRPDSETYGQHLGVLLNEDNKRQLFVPRGFAHGYVVLSDTALFAYKCDNFYSKNHEGGLAFDDPKLNIDWKIAMKNALLSDKDKIQPMFGDHLAFY